LTNSDAIYLKIICVGLLRKVLLPVNITRTLTVLLKQLGMLMKSWGWISRQNGCEVWLQNRWPVWRLTSKRPISGPVHVGWPQSWRTKIPWVFQVFP